MTIPTKQEIFTKVYKAMAKQGEPAMDIGSCRYLTSKGNRCAVGWLIDIEPHDDTLLNFLIEAECTAEVLEGEYYHYTGSGSLKKFIGEDGEFLNKIQKCHDEAANIDHDNFWVSFERRMMGVANEYGLEVPNVSIL